MNTILGPDPGDDVVFYARWDNRSPVGPFRAVDELTNYMTRKHLPMPDDMVIPSGNRGGSS